MSDKNVLLEISDGVAKITIDNAEKRNPLNVPTVGELIEAFETAQNDDNVLVIVLTGAGDRAFCAGGDLKAGKGGGAGLVCACDIAVMSNTARIATPEVKIGLFPMMIMPQMMRVIPRSRLLEMYITGEPWSAEQALEYGIVNYVTEPDALDAKVAELTDLITARSPSAVRLGKYSYHAMQDMTIEQQFRFAETMLPRIATTEDAREGFSAFLEKRAPEWTGR